MTVVKFLRLSSPGITPEDRLFYQHIFPREICPVQHRDSAPGFPWCGLLHEGHTSRLASLPVLGKLEKYDVSGLGEKGFE